MRANQEPEFQELLEDTVPNRASCLDLCQGCSIPLLMPGSHVGQYEIVRELGRGGMGVVYLAYEQQLKRQVAIKFPLDDTLPCRQQFVLEARATARCAHENIVALYSVGQHLGHPYMVLQYVNGQSLEDVWKTSKWSIRELVAFIVSVVRATAHIHEKQLVHRDLKPQNIFVDTFGAIKVFDFGIAKDMNEPDRPPANLNGTALNGEIMGTPFYMSPEQWAGEEVDPRSDIWSIGIMLYEGLAGEHPMEPFSAAHVASIMDTRQSMPSLRAKRPELGKLGAIVDACLAKKREDRPRSCRMLLAHLESVVTTM